jgi:hypothetical protein
MESLSEIQDPICVLFLRARASWFLPAVIGTYVGILLAFCFAAIISSRSSWGCVK